MSSTVRIIAADDHTLFLDGIASLLHQEDHFEVIHTASSSEELLQLITIDPPDIVLLDISINGLQATRHIHDCYPDTRVIILSYHQEANMALQVRNSGASGFLQKNCNKDDLINTIRLVHAGGTSFPGKACADNSFLSSYGLTRRELEIVELISRQHTNQQIADFLHLSIYTIETHRKNIMQKLQLKTPAALIRFILTNPCHSVIFGFYCLVLLS